MWRWEVLRTDATENLFLSSHCRSALLGGSGICRMEGGFHDLQLVCSPYGGYRDLSCAYRRYTTACDESVEKDDSLWFIVDILSIYNVSLLLLSCCIVAMAQSH